MVQRAKEPNIGGLTYKKVDNFVDVALETEAIIVMEVNCQGVFNLTPHQRRFAKDFPLTTKWFIEECIIGHVAPGMMITQEEAGMRIMLIVTSEVVIGKQRDGKIEIMIYTEDALDQVFTYLTQNGSHDDVIVSSIINRSFDCWSEVFEMIRDFNKEISFNNWIVAKG